jgi:hypothetical protein
MRFIYILVRLQRNPLQGTTYDAREEEFYTSSKKKSDGNFSRLLPKWRRFVGLPENVSTEYASTENVSTKALSQDNAGKENAGTCNASTVDRAGKCEYGMCEY